MDLYWIPLGAGTPVVRVSGRVFETLAALAHRRPRCDLYHAALQVRAATGRFVIEQAPAPDANGASRGVVASGPVGTRILGRFRMFRYEVRCWPNGTIPDLSHADGGPVSISDSPIAAARLLEVAPTIPVLVWGRDEACTGDMWNSNSVIAWILARSDIDIDDLRPPPGGRAPGWHAGIDLARRPTAPPSRDSKGPRGPTTSVRLIDFINIRRRRRRSSQIHETTVAPTAGSAR